VSNDGKAGGSAAPANKAASSAAFSAAAFSAAAFSAAAFRPSAPYDAQARNASKLILRPLGCK